MGDVAVSLVPGSSEVIRVVDEALTSPDGHHVTDLEILRAVVLNFLQVEAGVVSQDWGLGKLLAPQQHREGILTVIGLDDFFDFDGVVAQEVIASVEFVAAII